MKKLLLTLLTTAALFLVFDRMLGFALQYLYRQSNATDEYKVSYSNESATAPVLFFGSSRCLHHYVPAVFERQWGMECYNAADWGIKNIYYHYGLLGNLLSRYTPAVIIFEIHPCDWLQTPFSGVERAASLAPYVGMSAECDEMLRLTGNYWPYQLSWVYRYTGSLPNLLTGRFGSMDRSLKGWKPLDGTIDTVGIQAEHYDFPPDAQRIRLLERFAAQCRQRGIRLMLVASPMYVCAEEDVFAWPRQFAARHQLPFLDHYRDTAFVGHAELFRDFGHLNRQGAERFSAMLARELQPLVKRDSPVR